MCVSWFDMKEFVIYVSCFDMNIYMHMYSYLFTRTHYCRRHGIYIFMYIYIYIYMYTVMC